VSLDVRTQASYQLMDEGFVGLIFSVFNHDKVSKVSCVCCKWNISCLADVWQHCTTAELSITAVLVIRDSWFV